MHSELAASLAWRCGIWRNSELIAISSISSGRFQICSAFYFACVHSGISSEQPLWHGRQCPVLPQMKCRLQVDFYFFFDTKANHDTYSRPLFELPIRFALSGTSVHNLASLISIVKVPDLYMSLPCKRHVQGPPMLFFSCRTVPWLTSYQANRSGRSGR